MNFKTYLGPESKVRVVDVPDSELGTLLNDGKVRDVLNLIYRYGQNDIQRVEGRCSLSVGDKVEIPGHGWFRVDSLGFESAIFANEVLTAFEGLIQAIDAGGPYHEQVEDARDALAREWTARRG